MKKLIVAVEVFVTVSVIAYFAIGAIAVSVPPLFA